MPKEIINSAYYGQEVTAVDGTKHPAESTRFHVGWSKDGNQVEVAVINSLVKSEHPGDTSAGWFMQVDREGCNRAIRALRKARDAAFGRDE